MVKKHKKFIKLTKKFPFIRLNNNRRASLVVVEDLWTKCNTEGEKLLYHQLRANMYYPTPHYWIDHVRANIALVPFRLALIELRPGLNEKRIMKQLKRHHWRVIFYETEQLLKDEHLLVDLVSKQAPTKNVSTSS
ncbi:hypothetical protein [Halalkalibacter alkalisediminis]|uniref:DUF559 domain-containing protein n=1 Tax=Halalkalibacter alkalisediminis TaxID=935616 RepID=A0ABV6NAQ9_9BACI|nr:hypothetical protein [Halalkalibacter alkalisediminis]